MKERPILFNDEMVRAILNGSKTQTRRPVKPQPTWRETTHHLDHLVRKYRTCYSEPGDRLWARECFAPYDTDRLETVRVVYRASYDPMATGTAEAQGATRQFIVPHRMAMEWSHAIGLAEVEGEQWRPSIHMPRWASRITLVVKRSWVEKLQDISEADAVAEGVVDVGNTGVTWWDGTMNGTFKVCHGNARTAFIGLWDSIYAGKGYGWDENPWVWGCSFRKLNGA